MLPSLARRPLTCLFIAVCSWAILGAVSVAAPSHPLGANLLRNGDGTTGDASVQGWDSVTIPGWRVLAGLPTVVRYGTSGFARASYGARLSRLFAGGPGGTARLRESVSLRMRSGKPVAAATRYRVSAWLGGNSSGAAALSISFVSASGRRLGGVTLGPVGEGRRPVFIRDTVTGELPKGAGSAVVVLRLTTRLKNWDGPSAPLVGYNRAQAGGLSFQVAAPVIPPTRLVPPPTRVPRFDHVFLFMFENQDLRAVIGNRKQAPYLNSLLKRGSSLDALYAEEHPSDANYTALAAGGAFGIPLTDPLEINPHFTINRPQIGDLIDRAHESWRAYLQNANGPCDDTVHGYYWNDDLPFLYFPQVRNRPAYCARHDVPLEALPGDLASAATTPSFTWVGPDDCSDMEGCGIRAGDRFLQSVLPGILNSRAWRTQRSLAIITFDEDGYDFEHPPQLVGTLVLGSAGVRAGYVSHVRYTHYSLLRTIEAALGLPALTRNDRYAQPLNDVFAGPVVDPPAAPRRPAARRQLHPAPAHRAVPSHAVPWRRAAPATDKTSRRSHALTAFVANYASGTVTPVSLPSGKAAKTIRVGVSPVAVAITPDGRTAYVVNSGSGTVTPIDTQTRTAGRPIPVGTDPRAIAITPDGRTAYVVNSGSGTVTPIDTRTNQPQSAVPVGLFPRAIAITPDGRSAYAVNWGDGTLTPITVATNAPRPAIRVGSYPVAVTMAPNGSTAYTANFGSDTVTPITVATDQPGAAIAVGAAPDSIAISPDGSRLEVVNGNDDTLTPVTTATRQPGPPVRVGYSPAAVEFSSAATAWVVNTISGTVTPVAGATARAGRAVSVGTYSYPTAIAMVPGGRLGVVVDAYGGQVTVLGLRAHKALHTTTVGGYPDAVAIGG